MAKCLDTKPVLVCRTDAAGVKTTLIEHIIYQGGAAIGHAYTTQDTELPIALAATDVITVGACPVSQPDVEYITKCDDTANDGVTLVEFVAQVITTFDANGNAVVPNVVNNYQGDLVTPYVPVGTVTTGECGCAKITLPPVITTWSQVG